MMGREGVVLVHGLWMHGLVMTVLDRLSSAPASGMLVSEAVASAVCEFFRNGVFRRERQKVYA